MPTTCGLLGAGGLHTLGLPFPGAAGWDRGLRASWRGEGGDRLGVGPGMAVRQEARTLPSPAQLLTFGRVLCWDHGVDAGRQGGEEVPEEEQGVLWGVKGSDSEAGGGSGLGSGSVPTRPAHLIHVEPQGQQRDAEAALGAPQVGRGGHVQRFDLELKAGGELWAPLGLRPPRPHRSPSWSCRSCSLSESRLCPHPLGLTNGWGAYMHARVRADHGPVPCWSGCAVACARSCGDTGTC